MRQVIQDINHAVHFLQKIGLQGLVVRGAGTGLRHGRQIVTAGVAPQTGRLAVPAAQRPDTFWLRLAKGIAEVIQETVGVGFGQSQNELVTILDELGFPPLVIFVQHDLAQRK